MGSSSLREFRRISRHTCVILFLVLAGCNSPSAPRPPNELENPAIVTDSSAYTLVSENGGLGVTIHYVFTNQTSGPVYVENCHGEFSQVLQRWSGSAWVPAWNPALLDCQSAPIVINAGESFSTQLPVWGAPLGANTGPQWEVANPSGWYRLVWGDALSSYDPNAGSAGKLIPLDVRTSNSFELRR